MNTQADEDVLSAVTEVETRTTVLLNVNGVILTSEGLNKLPVVVLEPDVGMNLVGRALDESTGQTWVVCQVDGRLSLAIDQADLDGPLAALPVFTVRHR